MDRPEYKEQGTFEEAKSDYLRDMVLYANHLEAENANLKKSIRTYKFAIYDENSLEKLKAEGIREAATMYCPASGYVVRDEQARNDLMQYADFIEKQLPINLVENAND